MSRHFDEAKGLVEEQAQETEGYVFNQTMLRIKDPERTLAFYTGVLGMTLVKRLDFPKMEFSLYFLGALDPEERQGWSDDEDQRLVETFSRPALLELTHNWGDEDDDEVDYHSGNSDPRGFGHIGFSVPDLDAACQRFEEHGVSFQKKADEGSMKDIVFIKDPDGYWIEIFEARRLPSSLEEHLEA